MYAARRRLPTRLLASTRHELSSVSRPSARVALKQYGFIPERTTQSRSLFGLRELLFGKSEDAAVEANKEANKLTEETDVAKQLTQENVDDQGSEVLSDEAPVTQQSLAIQAPISYSTGKYARIASGGIMASCGDTRVLTTTVSDPKRSGGDFLPLTVDYRIKYYATGLIPSTATRKEMSGSNDEILQSRVLDRVLRPMFPSDYSDETQVISTVQSLDSSHDPLVVAINSASAALCVSDIPWNGPVGCARVVEVDGELVVHPTSSQRAVATLDVLYAANEYRTIMIEANGDQVDERKMQRALEMAHDAVQPLIQDQLELFRASGKEKRSYVSTAVEKEVMDKANDLGYHEAKAVLSRPHVGKQERLNAESFYYGKVTSQLKKHFQDRDVPDSQLQKAAHDVFQRALREAMLESTDKSAKRYDGRTSTRVRELGSEIEVLPMAHGSSVFSRGETQVLCSATLGPLDRALRMHSAHKDVSDLASVKHAMLHYEFPPYCVNETGRVGGVNRRMIGHGALAEKAILPVLPSITDFPYTVRMTSETMGSDGSSSMATVCGVSLALMDAGVPITSPVAGISIGLVSDGDAHGNAKDIGKYNLLTDILGSEDHFGDMDFKVAGTRDGITAIQLDVKLPGIPLDILCEALQKAKIARKHVLRRMSSTISGPRSELGNGQVPGLGIEFEVPLEMIPAIIGTRGKVINDLETRHQVKISIDRSSGKVSVSGSTDGIEAAKSEIMALKGMPDGIDEHASVLFQVDTNNIPFIIGSGGKHVNELRDLYKCKISVDSKTGDVSVAGEKDQVEAAKKAILNIRAPFNVGNTYQMRVAELLDFGAVLYTVDGQEHRAFVHSSELSDETVTDIKDVLQVGQEIRVMCIDAKRGSMSRKNVPAEGEEASVSNSKRPVASLVSGRRRSRPRKPRSSN